MKFENPQNNAKEQEIEAPDAKDASDFFENASAEEIAQILKQKESNDMNKNLAAIAAEQKDLDKKISDFESTLKSSTGNIDDKGATTQEDVNKLQKRKKTLATQGKKMQLKKSLTKYVKEQSDSGFAGSKKELEEIEKELEAVKKNISELQNYESKSGYTTGDMAAGKDTVLIKKKDAMEKDIVRLKTIVTKVEKVEQVKKLMSNEQEDMLENPEEGGDVQADITEKDVEQNNNGKKEDMPEGWSEKEKVNFDKEFQEGWDKKSLESKSVEDIQRMVRDLWKKRGELLGGEGNDEAVFQENEKKIQIARDVLQDRGEEDNPLALENMTFALDEKSSRDTDINEEEKFDKEVANRAQKELENVELDSENLGDEELADALERDRVVENAENFVDKEPEPESENNAEEIKKALDDARRAYTSIQYKSEGMMDKIKSVFGRVKEEDQDVLNMKAEYQTAVENYRNEKLDGLQNLSEDEQKKVMAELMEFDLNESISLYTDRIAAKAETFGGKLGECGLKVINQYKKLPTSVKLGLSGALFVGGVMSGTGLAAGVFGAATIGKRALGAGLAGVGATGFVEARAQKKEGKNIENSLESFQNLSIEEQKASLLGFDNTSFDKLNEAFHGKVTGRKKRVLAGMAAAVGVMSAGSVLGKVFGVGAAVESVNGHMPESGDIAQNGSGNINFDNVIDQKGVGNINFDNVIDQKGIGNINFDNVVDQVGENEFDQDDYINNEMKQEALEAAKGERRTEIARKIAEKMGLGDPDHLEYANNLSTINGQSVPEGMLTEEMKAYIAGKAGVASSVENVGTHMPESGDTAGVVAEQVSESTVNTEFLKEEAQKAMGEINIDTDIPNLEDSVESQAKTLQENTPDSGDGTAVDMSAAEAQMDASQLADNPEQVGWSGEGTNIEVNQDGIGTLTIENGGSIEGSLIAFFKENSDKLTEGGMGWDPDKFKDINEWAGKRAHGLAKEYMTTHPGFDLDTVQPGTSFEIDLNNTADIRVGEIDFEGGVHIVPEAEKVEILGSEDEVEAKSVVETNVAETINAKEGIMQAFGMDNNQYEFFQNAPADEYVAQMQTVPVENQTSLDRFLIEVSNREGVDLQGKTVGDILKATEINILEPQPLEEQIQTSSTGASPDTGEPYVPATEQVAEADLAHPEILNIADERELIGELTKNPEFNKAVAGQMQETYGMPAQNVGRARMGLLEGNNPVVQKQVEDVIARAKEQLGAVAGAPRDNTTVGTYFTRIFAQAAQKGKVKDIFPSSEFTV